MSWPVSVKLGTPVTVIDVEVGELRFRAPRGRDLIGAPDPGSDQVGWLLTVAARCCTNAPEETVLDLPLPDVQAVLAGVGGQMGPTGTPTS